MKNLFNNKMKSLISASFLLMALVLTANAQTPSETPPPPSEEPTLTIPEVKEMTLNNGLKVVVVRKRGLPLVSVSMLVKSGASSEDKRKAGVANMTANLLIKGTEFRTATDIAEQIDFLGGSLNSGSDWDASVVNLNVLKDKLGTALSVFSDSVIRPTFPAKELSLEKKQTLDGFNVSLKQPGALLNYVSNLYSFDEHLSGGTPQTISRIRRNDLVKYHRENYTPKNAVLIFTGDITDKQAFGYARLFFNSWQDLTRQRVLTAFVESPVIKGARDSGANNFRETAVIDNVLVVDLPDSGQAAVGYSKLLEKGRIQCNSVVNERLVCNSSEIFHQASVLNSVLGGGYSARLNQEIRLKRGLSYGARSGFDWRGFGSNFTATTQTKNESAAQVAELIKIEIEKLVNESITETELVPRKAVLTGGFGRGLQTNNGLAARLRELYLYDINTDELNSYMQNITKVSDTEVKEFAQNNLLGGNMIIVGDAKMFMDDLKKRFPNKEIAVIKAGSLNLNSSRLR